MPTQQIPGSFRSSALINVKDGVGSGVAAYESTWSPGATIIDEVILGPQINQQWLLQAIGIEAQLGLIGATGGQFGKLGKVIAGLFPSSSQSPGPTQGNVTPWITPMQPLPPDPSLTVALWDPNNDPLPPFSNAPLPPNASGILPVSGIIQLPQTVSIIAGEPIFIGIWMLPCLIGMPIINDAFRIEVTNATYALTYQG